jgi:7-carboxy-7-deazaguanine synthase
MTVDEIVARIVGTGIDHVVITGGEPMLFDSTVDLAARCRESGKTITIETAGTIYRDLPCDLMSISPKLANSTPDDPLWKDRHESIRLNLDALQRLIDRYDYQLKFVVGSDVETDLAEIERLLSNLSAIRPQQVLLMPEGTDAETLHRRARALVEPAMRRNWRLTPRMHIDLFGNQKGT